MGSPQPRCLVAHLSLPVAVGEGDEIVFKENNWGAMLVATV
jgi:hypothetical protein